MLSNSIEGRGEWKRGGEREGEQTRWLEIPVDDGGFKAVEVSQGKCYAVAYLQRQLPVHGSAVITQDFSQAAFCHVFGHDANIGRLQASTWVDQFSKCKHLRVCKRGDVEGRTHRST